MLACEQPPLHIAVSLQALVSNFAQAGLKKEVHCESEKSRHGSDPAILSTSYEIYMHRQCYDHLGNQGLKDHVHRNCHTGLQACWSAQAGNKVQVLTFSKMRAY